MYKKDYKYYLSRVAIYIPLWLILIVCVIPFLTIVAVSFTPEAEITKAGYKIIPEAVSLEAYKMMFRDSKAIVSAYKTTIITSVCGTALSIYLMATLGYVMSRNDFKWKKPLSFYIFFTMLFSGGMIPTYILVTQYLGLKNNILALFIPSLVGAWNVMLLKNFFMQLPTSLIESAKLDGASEFYIFCKIALPLTKTGIAVVTLFVFLGFWNEWMNSMLYMTKGDNVSIQYLLQKILKDASFMQKNKEMGMFTDAMMPEENLKMANCVIAAGPAVLVFPFFQKYFVKGMTVGSIKE